MLDSLYIGATGMNAQQLNVETVANNLSNVNTPAFKKSRVVFEDLVYREVRSVSTSPYGEGRDPLRLGIGVGIAGIGKIFSDGQIKKTDNPLDLAIQGKGFLEVTLPDGTAGFTRAGSLMVDRDGFLATTDGHQLRPLIQVPTDSTDLVIDNKGKVSVATPGATDRTDLGQIDLANFINPGGLNPIGNNLFLATDKSGDPILGKPGDESFGVLIQGSLESSNVSLVEELVNLIVAQRAYEINSKVVQASDEMLGIVNNLRR
jgi:flagellar basal-body rod protein FlgG